MSAFSPVRDTLAKRIRGDRGAATGQTMRKWRLLNVNQMELADKLELSPSVISDYETGRRQSPGSGFIKRYVEALLDIDQGRGGDYIRQMARITIDPSDVFTDIREFTQPVTVGQLCRTVDAEVLTGKEKLDQQVLGYTVIDSVKAITTLSGLDFYRIFGATSGELVFSVQGPVMLSNSPSAEGHIAWEIRDRPLAVSLAGTRRIPLGLLSSPRG
jgi:putative transcriptional regulator